MPTSPAIAPRWSNKFSSTWCFSESRRVAIRVFRQRIRRFDSASRTYPVFLTNCLAEKPRGSQRPPLVLQGLHLQQPVHYEQTAPASVPPAEQARCSL